MTEPIAEHLTSRAPASAVAASADVLEPPWALSLGGLAGAACFFLFAMLFGVRWAIAAAAAAALVALVKHERIGSISFVAAGALSAIALAPSTAALFIASLAFGGGLAFAARAYARTHEGISRL
jgi:hypothetical protein